MASVFPFPSSQRITAQNISRDVVALPQQPTANDQPSQEQREAAALARVHLHNAELVCNLVNACHLIQQLAAQRPDTMLPFKAHLQHAITALLSTVFVVGLAEAAAKQKLSLTNQPQDPS